jgi:membrane protein
MVSGASTLPANRSAIVATLEGVAGKFLGDNVPSLASSVAFFAIFSLVPFLVIVIALAGFFLGHSAVRDSITSTAAGVAGPSAATFLSQGLDAATRAGSSGPAALLGVLALLFGGLGVFSQLKTAVDIIWETPSTKKGGVMGFVRTYVLSAAAVVGIGFMLVVSFVASAAIASFTAWAGGAFPLGALVGEAANVAVSALVLTALFACMLRFMPEEEPGWPRAWVGGFWTMVLMLISKEIIALYIGHANFASTYGAGAAVIAILTWIYAASMIFLLGAELTHSLEENALRRSGKPVRRAGPGARPRGHPGTGRPSHGGG